MAETIEIISPQTSCDGGKGALGHPRVYLHVDAENGNKITCPYCSRTYVLKNGAHPAAA